MDKKDANNRENVPSVSDLGGEFPIVDLVSGETGVLHISMEGIGLVFENKIVSLFFKKNFKFKFCNVKIFKKYFI